MSDQEILLRMFICEFMGYPISESIVKEFDHEFTYLFRVMDNFFPREIEPESFEGVAHYSGMYFLEVSFDKIIKAINNGTKVKITILDSCEELSYKNGELK